MGRLSDQRRSARRPGKQERARAKKRLQYGPGVRRSGMWSSAWGAGTVTAYFGRKKWRRQGNIALGRNSRAHLVGESNEPERRAKAVGPHSRQAGVAPGPLTQ